MKLKKWLKLGTLTSLSFLSTIAFISADGDNTNQPPEGEQPAQEKPNYDELKSKQDETIKKSLETAIDGVVEAIDKEIKKENDIAKLPLSNEFLIKTAYYKKVVNYLKSNKEKILQNPYEYGLNVIFPKLLTEKNYFVASASLLDEYFSPVMVGEGSNLNYEVINKYENHKIENLEKDKVENEVGKEAIDGATKSYFESILSEFDRIFINADDLPKYSEDSKILNLQENSQYDIVLPENYESWDQYINKQIDKRFTLFDLKQNELFNKKDEEQPQPIPPKPPLIIPDEIVDAKEVEPQVENIPRLAPILTWNLIGKSKGEIIGAFNNNQELFNTHNAFFYNPLLTSFDYKITNLEEKGEQLIARINLSYKNDPSNSTEYEIEVKLPMDADEIKGKKVAIEALKNTFKLFYDALNLGENLEFENLGNPLISKAVFNQVFTGINLINENNFISLLNNIINENKSTTSFNEEKQQLNNPDLSKNASEFFVKSLNNQTINNLNYFYYLSASYSQLLKKYVNYAKENKTIILDNLKKLNLDSLNIDIAFNVLANYIAKLEKSALGPNFNFGTYKNYVMNLKVVQDQLVSLSVLTSNKELDTENQEETNKYKEAYNKLILNEPENTQENNVMYVVIGVIAGLVLLGLGVNIVQNIKKNKKVKVNKGEQNE